MKLKKWMKLGILSTLMLGSLGMVPASHGAIAHGQENADSLRNEIWKEYCNSVRKDTNRKSEDENCSIRWGDVTMKYGMQIIGQPDANGLYPLYIALHGGGSDPTGNVNDDQWDQMSRYYRRDVRNGIYVNPRAVRDTWDCHSNPESYPIYDRLIENMILFHNADPNRVYLLGFSAGGDGVYQISPRMADRFAAANMSAGHPNSIALENLYNLPLQLQVGINDTNYNRHKVTAEYGILLEKLHSQYGGGYDHRTNIHVGHAHNFDDFDSNMHEIVADIHPYFTTGNYTTKQAMTGAVRFVDQYRRNPLPDTVVWNLGVRAPMREVESFYWLSAPKTTTSGIITAHLDRNDNRIVVTTDGNVNGDFSILLSTQMLDFNSPITVEIDENVYEVHAEINSDVMTETLCEREDASYIFEDRISLNEMEQSD